MPLEAEFLKSQALSSSVKLDKSVGMMLAMLKVHVITPPPIMTRKIRTNRTISRLARNGYLFSVFRMKNNSSSWALCLTRIVSRIYSFLQLLGTPRTIIFCLEMYIHSDKLEMLL